MRSEREGGVPRLQPQHASPQRKSSRLQSKVEVVQFPEEVAGSREPETEGVIPELPETTIRTVEVPLKIREEAAAAREEATRRQEEPIIAPQEKGKKIAEAAPQQKKKDEGVQALKYEPLASPNNSFLE